MIKIVFRLFYYYFYYFLRYFPFWFNDICCIQANHSPPKIFDLNQVTVGIYHVGVRRKCGLHFELSRTGRLIYLGKGSRTLFLLGKIVVWCASSLRSCLCSSQEKHHEAAEQRNNTGNDVFCGRVNRILLCG